MIKQPSFEKFNEEEMKNPAYRAEYEAKRWLCFNIGE